MMKKVIVALVVPAPAIMNPRVTSAVSLSVYPSALYDLMKSVVTYRMSTPLATWALHRSHQVSANFHRSSESVLYAFLHLAIDSGSIFRIGQLSSIY
jgi:hypothetical protein